ncbi:hypothetical protein C3424_09320 [Citrobacter amalonaticus]|nr:hypothetical protein C3436_02015 [Citrobacter amalonaticus]POV05518.1 hypothetical protein C3424_09320 [Citrobacter amalonaticus]
MHREPEEQYSPADKEIIHAAEERRKHCNKYGDDESDYKARPVILQATEALPAELLVSFTRLALTGRRSATFKSVPDRFVAHPSHIVIYAPGDLLVCRLSATRII